MKRLLLALIALPLCAGMLVYTLPVQADRPYDNSDLDGIYYFASTEIRTGATATTVQYCNSYGTIDFDGEGEAEVEESWRCVEGTSITGGDRTAKFDYDVDSDGSFILDTDPENIHCQILNRGKLILCDGVDNNPDTLKSYLSTATRL